MTLKISSPDDPDEELTFVKDRGASPSLRSKLWEKEEGARVS